MGNQHSGAHAVFKPKKNVHWKTAGRPAPPGKPEVIPISSEEEPNAITLRWKPPAHDGGSPLVGYQVECNRLGTPAWIRTAPPIVLRPELVLSGLEPPHRYQFRVAALNRVGRSDYSELSDVLTVNSERETHRPPSFLQHLEDVTALENDKTEFRVTFTGTPTPTVAWFKDGYEIFSSRRTAITTVDNDSVLVFHQTLPSDEGEIKCTITNRAGHAVSKGRLILEAAPKLRYPRQYEDGLLYEINETVFLKTSVVGKPTPVVEWRHDGQPIVADERIEILNTPKFSVLKIHSANRSDRGEYQIHARNRIGEDTAAFLVTITAPPDAPRRVSVTRQVDKSVTLDWEPPDDDGGCRIGNYVVEYYRSGWNVWLKATTSRKTSVTLFDLIEGSEYRFRVKAESPYGMSAPSEESAPVRIPGRAVDMEFLAVESRIINDVLLNQDGEEKNEPPVTPVPRRKRNVLQPKEETLSTEKKKSPIPDKSAGSNEFMLVLYPESEKPAVDKSEKRKSFQLDLEDALSPPPISLSAPELSSRCILPFKALRNSVSSTELLHERAMARFYKAIAMKEEKTNKQKENDANTKKSIQENVDIPLQNTKNDSSVATRSENEDKAKSQPVSVNFTTPEIIIKTDSIENKDCDFNSRQSSQDSEHRWQSISFDEDYTASTVSTDAEYSDEGSLNEDMDRRGQYANEEDTYNPRDKSFRSSPFNESEDNEFGNNKKLMPVPDPNFVPKPILKKKETDVTVIKEEPPKKEERMTILKKITKMPVQNPFPFPKILAKREPHIPPKEATETKSDQIKTKVPQKNEDMDEGRTVIEYYGNIVKEYGSQKKAAPPLYLNTEDLKTVAEIQQIEKSNTLKPKSTDSVTSEEAIASKKRHKNKQLKPLTKMQNSISKEMKPKSQLLEKPKVEQKSKRPSSPKSPEKLPEKLQDKQSPQVLLKTAERATIVIPINYEELEQQAKVTVRSAIDYTVDFCLLLLAFWAYFFKDERLAIPFLVLIIYRQLQETVMMNIPRWIKLYAPNWLKTKKS